MDTSILIAYKLNNNWIYVNDFKLIPKNVKSIKINNYVFEDFENFAGIIEMKSIYNKIEYIIWISIFWKDKAEIIKITDKLERIPLVKI
ncbi:MAG: hypothetical protein GYA14_14085 [Ignavibacteria bacterium]|nr:hypothetical protein [Ignavibacteria bacterium]